VKRLFITLLLTTGVYSPRAFAMPQEAEILIYKEGQYTLRSLPLASYFKSYPVPPALSSYFTWCSAANYRGYQGTWEIKGDSLYLVRLEKGCRPRTVLQTGKSSKNTEKNDGLRAAKQRDSEIPLTELFSGQETPIKAAWYSGQLCIPQGKYICNHYSGWGKEYSNKLLLSVENGVVTNKRVIDSGVHSEADCEEALNVNGHFMQIGAAGEEECE
jgi:hypothetical protein